MHSKLYLTKKSDMTKLKLLTFLLVYFVSFHTINAQAYQWAASFGGSGRELGNAIAIDTKGNIFTTGNFTGMVDFDPGTGIFNMTSNGSTDIFISKLNSTGSLIWAKRIGAKGSDIANAIQVDELGNIYIAGNYFNDTVDFDPGTKVSNLVSAGKNDIFILKLDAKGEFIWAKSMGGTGVDDCTSLAIDGLGNVYTTGSFNTTADFDPGSGTYVLSSNSGTEIFVSKLNSEGKFVWAKSLGGPGSEGGTSIKLDSIGNVYTTGFFYSIADFDPGIGKFELKANGIHDLFVSKLDNSGNFVWAKSIGGKNSDMGYSLAIASSGNIYVSGYFMEKVDFNPGVDTFYLTPKGYQDAFLLKLNSIGDLIWVKSFGGINGEQARSIVLDKAENIYITGLYQNTSDFDPGAGVLNFTSQGGSYDVFLLKLNSNGNLQWAKSLGGSDYDIGNALDLDASENIILLGYFDGLADLDPQVGVQNVTSNGDFDVFILKLSQTLSAKSLKHNDLVSVFPNPSNGEVSIFGRDKISSIVITNAVGKEIYEAKPNHNIFSLQLKEQGFYFIFIESAGKAMVYKMRVQ